MSLTVTRPTTHEATHWSGGGAGGSSKTYNTPAKILIPEQRGFFTLFIPCNYQFWFWGQDDGVWSGNMYVPSSDDPVNPTNLREVLKISFKSRKHEGEDFHDFIARLMRKSMPEQYLLSYDFVCYDGVEEMTLPQRYWKLLGIRIPKPRQTRFVHHFSLYRKNQEENRG